MSAEKDVSRDSYYSGDDFNTFVWGGLGTDTGAKDVLNEKLDKLSEITARAEATGFYNPSILDEIKTAESISNRFSEEERKNIMGRVNDIKINVKKAEIKSRLKRAESSSAAGLATNTHVFGYITDPSQRIVPTHMSTISSSQINLIRSLKNEYNAFLEKIEERENQREQRINVKKIEIISELKKGLDLEPNNPLFRRSFDYITDPLRMFVSPSTPAERNSPRIKLINRLKVEFGAFLEQVRSEK